MPNVYWVRFAFAFAAMLLGLAGAHAADAQQSSASLPRTVADITRMLTEYKAEPKKTAEQLAILESKPPQTDSKKGSRDVSPEAR